MFDVYWGRDCVGGSYKTDDEAAHAAHMIIERNNGEILASGHDGDNWWWAVRFYDAYGFADYECFSVCKNCK